MQRDCIQSRCEDANGHITLPSSEYLLQFLLTSTEACTMDKFQHPFPDLLQSLAHRNSYSLCLEMEKLL